MGWLDFLFFRGSRKKVLRGFDQVVLVLAELVSARIIWQQATISVPEVIKEAPALRPWPCVRGGAA